jgi:alkyl hydroperoxide reductase subunit D
VSFNELKEKIPDFAKDIRLNLGSVLSETGAPGLTASQIWGVALASAYATKEQRVISAILDEAKKTLTEAEITASKSAATIMALNNVYYRSMHLMEDKELAKLPAKLRMNVIGSPGIDKISFELYCLGVSAISGCGACLNAHAHEVKKGGIHNEGVQSTIRIASVVNAASQAVNID